MYPFVFIRFAFSLRALRSALGGFNARRSAALTLGAPRSALCAMRLKEDRHQFVPGGHLHLAHDIFDMVLDRMLADI